MSNSEKYFKKENRIANINQQYIIIRKNKME